MQVVALEGQDRATTLPIWPLGALSQSADELAQIARGARSASSGTWKDAATRGRGGAHP